MPKIRLRRLVAVFAYGQSLRTTPLCYIVREDAEWWVASGGANVPRGYGKCIVLTKIKSTELLGLSARMGPQVQQAVAGGSKYHAEILRRWRFGFVEPPVRQPQRQKIRSRHFAAPPCAEA